MAKEICISSTPHETRLAILEDDQLAEIYYERENEYTLAGSIYNGRVTRVLPGMQSAFVDLGLERDAFLYVTDFIELEDQEETDELEKAAAGGTAPHEVHHGQSRERSGGRHEDRGQRNGQRQDAQASQFRPAEEAATGAVMPPSPDETSDSSGKTLPEREGGQRWRGRRRRRGGRGPGGSPMAPTESGPAAEPFTEAEETDLPAAEVHPPVPHAGAREERHPRASERFLLPGESLSKYGGTPDAENAKPAAEAEVRARRATSAKPSTLVEAPLSWDGSGVLPGESLSRHRGRQVEPEGKEVAERHDEPAIEPEFEDSEEVAFEEMEELVPPALHEIEAAGPQEPAIEFEEDFFVSHSETLSGEEALPELEKVEESIAGEPDQEPEAAQESALDPPREGGESSTSQEGEGDASASHRVDPNGPTGFRLFGFGGKKKKDDETKADSAVAEKAQPKSTYTPGAGLVEEEVIEGEEFESPHRHRHKAEAHDLDDYEEETLPTHLRTGDLGEMLQEAHLDHRIQMDLDDKGVEEEAFETADEEEAPAGAPSPASRDRQPRGRREQRGRGIQGGRRAAARRSAQTSNLPIISDLLKSGQEILVQIAKEPIAKKGARITSHIALPGRFLVFMPTVGHVGVSRKIASDEERHRLKRVLLHERGDSSGGFIVRTAAEGASEEELRADLRFLMNLWSEIKQRSEQSKAPALIYHDLSLIERILRDQVSETFASIWVDSQEDYERIVRFLNRFSPNLVRRVKLYTKETPLFEHFGIQDEISKALRSKVWLKSGGSIVINQTEALVAIDINTGKYVGKSARLEDTILKTNLDAVPEIVRQIRLRDLGGIIVIDFIDMDERKNRFKVMAALEEALKSDRAPTKVLQFNDFGLVAITRKRVKQSLERTLSVPCPTCQATGMVKSPATVCNEIYIEMRKMRKHFENADVMLRVHPETVKILKSNGNRWLNEFEELIGKNVLVKSDPTLHPEQFDIQG